MYPRIPWELVADPLGSAEHTLGSTALRHYYIFWKFMKKEATLTYCYVCEIYRDRKNKGLMGNGCQEECSSPNPQFPIRFWFFNSGLFSKTLYTLLARDCYFTKSI